MTISQNEAIEVSLAVCTAMLTDDKQAREAIYDGLEAEDLKRVLRWTSRFYLGQFALFAKLSNVPTIEAWQAFCADAIVQIEGKDAE